MTLVTGYDTPPTVWDQDNTWQLNIDSTSFIPGDPEVGTTFMAPTSGRVLLILGGGGRDNEATNRVAIGPEIYTGTQPIDSNRVFEPDFNELWLPGEVTESIYASRVTMVSGLAPYEQHYARVVYRCTGGDTCDIFVREVIVVPLP